MARIKFFVVISIALLISCKDTNIDVVNGVIVFDNSKEYPALNLNLSDLADISYISLGGEDTVNFLTLTYSLARQCYIDTNYIVMPDATPYKDIVSKCDDNIYFFNHSGEFVNSFGVGPKKAWNAYSYKNVVVLSSGKIGVYNSFGEGPLVICDYTGRIIKTDSLAKRYTASSVMNNRLILYDGIYKFLKGPDYYKGRALDIYDVDKGVISDFDDLNDVDSKLVRLAKQTDSSIMTNDFNLNKVAEIQGIKVLNINELANAIKPVVISGEEMSVYLVKEGKEPGQAVAYLDDGTMIVVENGRRFVGSSIEVTVTSVLQTAAGRMIFARANHSSKN